MTVSGEAFTRQMLFLKDRLMPLETLVSGLSRGDHLIPKKAVVTFDDGYVDLYTRAFPLIQKFRIPAALFLITGWVGREGFLSWEMVREMSREGVTFGSHSRNHSYLPSLPSRERLLEEIRGSKKELEDHLGERTKFFSYPLGGFSDVIKEMVQEAGYEAAVTTNRGEKNAGRDCYALSRIKMTEKSTSRWVLLAKSSGYYEHFKRKKKPY